MHDRENREQAKKTEARGPNVAAATAVWLTLDRGGLQRERKRFRSYERNVTRDNCILDKCDRRYNVN